MAAKKNVEENVKEEEFFEEEVVTDELTSDEAKATTENSKKEGFIKKGWNGYKASFKAHPVKTFIKTIIAMSRFKNKCVEFCISLLERIIYLLNLLLLYKANILANTIKLDPIIFLIVTFSFKKNIPIIIIKTVGNCFIIE